MIKISHKAPKYPRVLVSNKRHAQLTREAKRTGSSVAALAENVFAGVFDRKSK